MINIPDFKSTNEAYEYGLKASNRHIEKLSVLQKAYAARVKQCIEEEHWNIAAVYATKSQFCREAIEAHNGTLVL